MQRILKPFKTFDEQIDILEKRGLDIENEAYAKDILSKINYYRFSGYAFLRQNKNSVDQEFVCGTSFESIYALYKFDQKFRNTILKYLEPIEILARTRVAYYFSQNHKNDFNDCHYCPNYFNNPYAHAVFIRRLEGLVDKNKDVPFVKKHIDTYDGRMPLWSAVEILSFSSVSLLYSIMLEEDKLCISKSLGHTSGYLENWLHVLSVLRNRCAHYGRLYGVTIAPPLKLPKSFKRAYPNVKNDTVFAAICIMCKLLLNSGCVGELIDNVHDLLKENETRIDLNELKFPNDWESILDSLR